LYKEINIDYKEKVYYKLTFKDIIINLLLFYYFLNRFFATLRIGNYTREDFLVSGHLVNQSCKYQIKIEKENNIEKKELFLKFSLYFDFVIEIVLELARQKLVFSKISFKI